MSSITRNWSKWNILWKNVYVAFFFEEEYLGFQILFSHVLRHKSSRMFHVIDRDLKVAAVQTSLTLFDVSAYN